jgi:hypothetical protein
MISYVIKAMIAENITNKTTLKRNNPFQNSTNASNNNFILNKNFI